MLLLDSLNLPRPIFISVFLPFLPLPSPYFYWILQKLRARQNEDNKITIIMSLCEIRTNQELKQTGAKPTKPYMHKFAMLPLLLPHVHLT